MENYLVVLFKNKLKKRIIKKFVLEDRANNFFSELVNQNKEIIFETKIQSGKNCNYELGLVEMNSKNDSPIYMTDEFGRNVKVQIDDEGMTIRKIVPFKKEERIFDLQKKTKIKVSQFMKEYLTGDILKMLSVINNKVVVQKDDKVSLFSLKNSEEANRFLDCLSSYYFKIKKGDCLFVKDFSTAQKKYLFKLLEESGIDKKVLYRKYTTFPRPLK